MDSGGVEAVNIGDRVCVVGYPFHGYVGTVLRVGELDVRVQLDAGPLLWLSPGELEVIGDGVEAGDEG